MAVYSVSVRKNLEANDLFAWSNVWHVNATDLAAAADYANTLVNAEIALHSGLVRIYQVHVAHVLDPGDFITNSFDATGTLDTTGDPLPKFLAVRVDLNPGSGRVGRKFFHSMLGEAQQADGLLTADAHTNINNAIETMFGVLSGILTNDTGVKEYLSGTVFTPITQHQFKRKWARRGGP